MAGAAEALVVGGPAGACRLAGCLLLLDEETRRGPRTHRPSMASNVDAAGSLPCPCRRFAISSESTRQRLASYDYGPSSITPHFRCGSQNRYTCRVCMLLFETTLLPAVCTKVLASASAAFVCRVGTILQILQQLAKIPPPCTLLQPYRSSCLQPAAQAHLRCHAPYCSVFNSYLATNPQVPAPQQQRHACQL